MDEAQATISDEAALDSILTLVRTRTGLDFSGYRRPTMQRRVRNRMVSVGAGGFAAYLGVLQGSRAETSALVDRLTIKVSRFYRNAPAFDLLRRAVLPSLAKGARGPLRLWSAGCGRGEEPYTLAMLLEESGIPGSVLATDIDEGALAHGVRGVYAEAALEELPAELRARFLEDVPGREGHWRVAQAVRARASWRQDNLAHEGIEKERFDLISCRNVLIYLDRPTQERVFSRIAGSLLSGGHLLLGEAEWPSPALLEKLASVAPRSRLFRIERMEGIAA